MKDFYLTGMTDHDLLTMVCDSGKLADEVQKLSPTLRGLNKLTVHDLMAVPGIGEQRAKKILATLEIARRMKYETVPVRQKIKCSQDAQRVLELQTGMDGISHEEFWCIYVNRANEVMQVVKISEGGISGTVTDVRLILNMAVRLLASGIILSHNHPSGNLSPSEADMKITKKIKDAANLLDISVLDHLIISERGYLSFADENLMP